MPRDLFDEVATPHVRIGSGKWYTVPVSILVHGTALIAVVAAPLLATGALPAPRVDVVFAEITPVIPPAPAPPKPGSSRVDPPVEQGGWSAVIPDGVAPEPTEPFEVGDTVAGSDPLAGLGVVGGRETLVAPPPPPVAPPAEPVRVGGQIRAPEKVQDVAPVYPAIAMQARVEGVVIIEAVIGTDGRVQDARVLRPEPLLDQAALTAVRQWVYRPTLLNGIPVPVIMTVTVQFRLK